MNDQRYPLLEKLHVLRTAALCAMRDRAFDSLPLYYSDYSDGIVSGCGLVTEHDTIVVEPGIIRHGGFMYFIREAMSLPYRPTEEYLLLKLRFGMPEESEDFIYRALTMELSPDMQLQSDEMELCRFKLKAGAVLRTKYVDFFDRVTEFDTVDYVSSPYAAIGKSTLHPDILHAFASEAMAYNLSGMDEVFCMNALARLPISYDAISFYVARRLQVEAQNWDNLGLYQSLCQILRDIQNSGERNLQQARRRRREVFVD